MKGAQVDLLLPNDSVWCSWRGLDVYQRPGYVDLDARWVSGTALALRVRSESSDTLVPLIERSTKAGNRDWISPYGYPWDGPVLGSPDAGVLLRSIARYATESSVSAAFVRSAPSPTAEETPGAMPLPMSHLVGKGHTTVRRVNHTYSLELSSGDLLDSYSKGTRRDIRRALRDPLDVNISSTWDSAEILDLYHDSLDRLGASSYHYFSREYLDSLRSVVDEDQFLCTVYSGEQLVAFGLFFTGSETAQYHLSAGDAAHPLRGYAMKLMLHSGALECRDRGSAILHLGGAPARSAGLDDMKRRFSTIVNDYLVAEIVPSRSRYSEEVREGACGLADSEHFPAYRS